MRQYRTRRPTTASLNMQQVQAERNSSELVALVLEDVKAEPGRLAKHQILRALRDNSDLALKVMMAVFDVNVTYGVKKIPEPRRLPNPVTGARSGPSQVAREFEDCTWVMLGALADRTLTGKKAQEVISLELGSLLPASRALLVAILQQNLRAGFSADVVNDVWGPVLKVVKIQLAHDYYLKKKAGETGPRKVNPKARFPAWYDVKYDGVRGFDLTDDFDMEFFSRKGLPVETPPSLYKLVTEFLKEVSARWWDGEELLLDCEVVSLTGGFKDVMSQVRASKRGAEEGTTGIRIIDIITKQEYEAGRSKDNQRARRTLLELIVAEGWFAKYSKFIQLTEGREIHNKEEAEVFYAEVLAGGGEGAMHKHWEDHWEGKRTIGWLKLKPAEEIEGEIVGYKEGAKHSRLEGLLGAVLVRIPNGTVVSVDGMTDKVRAYIDAHREELLGETAELLYHEMTPDGSLRHPRFKPGFIRDDK